MLNVYDAYEAITGPDGTLYNSQMTSPMYYSVSEYRKNKLSHSDMYLYDLSFSGAPSWWGTTKYYYILTNQLLTWNKDCNYFDLEEAEEAGGNNDHIYLPNLGSYRFSQFN